jgi:hypothetical protein
MTSNHPAVRRTLARLRLTRMAMKRAGRYMPGGYRKAVETDVTLTWARYGWRPPERKQAAEVA